MKISHHGLEIELPDDWWSEAAMTRFVPTSKTYKVDRDLFKDLYDVSIAEVGPVLRVIGIFRDSSEGIPARERVVRILQGFRLNETIPPIQLVESKPGSAYRYKLTDGTHRLYCSIAAGFDHVPAIAGFDWNS